MPKGSRDGVIKDIGDTRLLARFMELGALPGLKTRCGIERQVDGRVQGRSELVVHHHTWALVLVGTDSAGEARGRVSCEACTPRPGAWAAEDGPLDEGRRVLIVPEAGGGAAFPVAGAAAPAAATEVGSYNSMVFARRAKLEGVAPGPRWGGSKYRPSRVGWRHWSAASSVVGQESGSSAEAREVRAHARAAHRSLSSLGGMLGGTEIPESARNCCCCGLVGMSIFGWAAAQSLAKVGVGGGMAGEKQIKRPQVGGVVGRCRR